MFRLKIPRQYVLHENPFLEVRFCSENPKVYLGSENPKVYLGSENPKVYLGSENVHYNRTCIFHLHKEKF